ncbi:MAG: MFS transporter [Clostridiales bacterium]|nr:MFS transporter [Clostridiales bacterium]
MIKKEKGFSMYRSNFGGRGWFVIMFSFVVLYLVTASLNTMNVTAEAFSQAHNWNSTILFSFQTIAGWVAVFTMIITGHLAQKYSPKKLSLITLIIFGVAFAVWGHVNALWQFLVVLICLQVFGSAAAYNGNSVIIANWFPRKKALAIGWASIGMPLAAATGVILMSTLLVKIGLQGSYYVFGAVTLVLVVLGLIFLRDNPEEIGCFPDNDRTMTKEQAQAILKEGMEQDKHSIWTAGRCLKTKEVWLIGISLGLQFLFANGVMGQFIPKMMSMGFDMNLSIGLLTVGGVCACIGSYLAGLFDAKFGPRTASIVSFVLAIVALLLSIIPSIITIVIGTAIIGIMMGGADSYLFSYCVHIWGRFGFPRAYKVMLPINQCVGATGPVLVAVLAAVAGGKYTLAYLVMAGLGVVGIIMLLFVKDDFAKKAEEKAKLLKSEK